MPTAIMVDGGFFIKRYRSIFSGGKQDAPATVAKNMYEMLLKHLSRKGQEKRNLYRIFYYDCPPLDKKAHNPVTGKAVDFSKSTEAIFRWAFYNE